MVKTIFVCSCIKSIRRMILAFTVRKYPAQSCTLVLSRARSVIVGLPHRLSIAERAWDGCLMAMTPGPPPSQVGGYPDPPVTIPVPCW